MLRTDPRATAARAFVRSLNILLKFARLYGFEHSRTAAQLAIAWKELLSAIPDGSTAGLLLGATGSQLLLDGVPLDGLPAERQFAQLLSAAGLASVHFLPSVSQEELERFAQAFPAGKAKPAELAQHLKTALSSAGGIRINEICFVATDASFRDAQVAAQLTAKSLGADASEFKQWLNDPQKLLQLIAAAQGSKGGPATAGTAWTSGAPHAEDKGAATPNVLRSSLVNEPAVADESSLATGGTKNLAEEDLIGIFKLLASLGQATDSVRGSNSPGLFQEQLSQIPVSAKDTIHQALTKLASETPSAKPDEAVLVRLAEHLAIRFALERYERGEVQVNAVRQMLDRMNQEIENLRKILGAHENKMTEAGLVVDTHADLLDRQFWAAVPESGKRSVLNSPEAWCIPPRNVRQYVIELMERGEVADACAILQNYASCANSDEPDARRNAAVGLAELAELYTGDQGGGLLRDAIRHVGLQLSLEREDELQALVGAAFVRLSQEAASQRCFPAIQQALDSLDGVETQRPAIARDLRPKMGVEERVPEFIDEALRAKKVAAGLSGVLRLLSHTAMEQLSMRFSRCNLRDDCDQIAALARELGDEGLSHLRGALRAGSVADAVECVGLMSRLEPDAVQEFLPVRIGECPRTSQDRMIRQIAASGAPERSRLILSVFDLLDPAVLALAIDEIGMSGDREVLGRLMCIADGDLPASAGAFLRVKAVEALGRLQCPESVNVLKRILEARQMWRWSQPQELRIAAMQVLLRLEPAWAEAFLPLSGIDADDLAVAPLAPDPACRWVRQRRYSRTRLVRPLRGVTTNLKDNCQFEIKSVSLSGGVATTERHLQPGTQVTLRLQGNLRGVRATAIMRDYRAQDMAFEIVDMKLDERNKLRHFLGGRDSVSIPTSPASKSAVLTLSSR